MDLTDSLPFGPGALGFVGLYAAVLFGIGYFAWRQNQKQTLSEFFLAGRNMSLPVLFFTLYATQYSGNTLFGFSGAAYRDGLGFLVCVQFMTAIVIAYLVLAPPLFRLSQKHQFITPGDFIEHRYQSKGLRLLITVLMLFALCNFTLAQLKTMGTAFAGISGGRIPAEYGVIGLALVMLIYESLGGMRSVAWTDVLQGLILFIGFLLLMYSLSTQNMDFTTALSTLAADPERAHKLAPPEGDGIRTWVSFIFLVGLGAAIYPQALQRIYSARSVKVLKQSLAFMAFMPFCTALIAVIIGVWVAAKFPDLTHAMGTDGGPVVLSETVLPILCLEVMNSSELGYWAVVGIYTAILAALMSTADSSLLSISSMITQDIYRPVFNPTADQAVLTRRGKQITWAIMVVLVWLALGYRGTLIQLLEIKFELLIQCVPAFYLGLYRKELSAKTIAWGIGAGLIVTMGLNWAGSLGLADQNYKRVWGIHTGLIGLMVNLMVCLPQLCKKYIEKN